jgi:hypothetical protein
VQVRAGARVGACGACGACRCVRACVRALRRACACACACVSVGRGGAQHAGVTNGNAANAHSVGVVVVRGESRRVAIVGPEPPVLRRALHLRVAEEAVGVVAGRLRGALVGGARARRVRDVHTGGEASARAVEGVTREREERGGGARVVERGADVEVVRRRHTQRQDTLVEVSVVGRSS